MLPKAKLEISHSSTTFTNTIFTKSPQIRSYIMSKLPYQSPKQASAEFKPASVADHTQAAVDTWWPYGCTRTAGLAEAGRKATATHPSTPTRAHSFSASCRARSLPQSSSAIAAVPSSSSRAAAAAPLLNSSRTLPRHDPLYILDPLAP